MFSIPWTVIPRTNSIIYQSHWMEILFPLITTNFVLSAGHNSLNLVTWFKDESLMSINNILRLYFLIAIPYSACYILIHFLWTVYLEYHHPMPNTGVIMYLYAVIAFMTGIWFILPSRLLAEQDFRQKLSVYTLYLSWIGTTIIQSQILIYLWQKLPDGFQFPIAFLVAGFRELDQRVQSKLVTRMVGIQDEPAMALQSITVSSRWSFFIAIRLVGAEFGTILCTVIIDFILHMRKTFKSIKESKRIRAKEVENDSMKNNINITKLILAELIEGLTPIIYGVCIAIAFYGPNAHILSNVGNTYWSKPIEDIGYLFLVMFGLFAFDTLSAVINSLWLWKMVKLNMLQEFSRVLKEYWLFMAVKLAFNMMVYFSANDINFGMDRTRSFPWVSHEGWINLVNSSKDLSYEEKVELLTK